MHCLERSKTTALTVFQAALPAPTPLIGGNSSRVFSDQRSWETPAAWPPSSSELGEGTQHYLEHIKAPGLRCIPGYPPLQLL